MLDALLVQKYLYTLELFACEIIVLCKAESMVL